jgi:NAD(P)-dependent dehydrogenase (short-subunit alcohol dehydrogenase family)
MGRMDGKICVVTGATQRLGAAIAQRLALARAPGVVVTGRNAVRGNEMAAGLARPALFVTADPGNPDDCARVIADADHRFGRSICRSMPGFRPRGARFWIRRPGISTPCSRLMYAGRFS